MLFWLFIIIGVVTCIGAFVITAFAPNEDDLKEARDDAMRAWSLSLEVRAHPNEIDEKREAYYAAYEALQNYRASNRTKEKVYNGFAIAFFTIAIVAAVVIFISSIILLISHGTAGGERARLEAEYETLCWEVENKVYHDGGDDVVGKKELYNQVREWNKNLASNQYYEKNFWVGIFCPDIYSDLQFIELK
jgi:hypothetical protein